MRIVYNAHDVENTVTFQRANDRIKLYNLRLHSIIIQANDNCTPKCDGNDHDDGTPLMVKI